MSSIFELIFFPGRAIIKHMEQLIVLGGLVLLGLIFGSFAGAQVWRLRAKQLYEDKRDNEPYDKKEYKRLDPLRVQRGKNDHSRCLECGHRLGFKDLIPLGSWLSTAGRCRYCKRPIGAFEPLVEMGVAATFVSLYVFWPYGFNGVSDGILFVVWCLAAVVAAILFAYDLKWFLLPNRPVFLLVLLGLVAATVTVVQAPQPPEALLSIAGAIAILSGIYAGLWLLSQGRWIGFGDVKLGLALALLLADWRLGFIALFAANLIGCLLVLPGMASGKVARNTRIPFGPLLIAGAFVSLFFGNAVMAWYGSLL